MSWLRWNKPLTPRQREKLERMLARGKASFIWRWGVLGWGVPVFLGTTILDYYTQQRAHKPFNGDVVTLSVHLGIWLIAGCAFGASMWKRYKDMLDRQP